MSRLGQRLTYLRRLPWAAVRLARARLPRRLRRALAVLVGLQLLGTLAYPLIEGRAGPLGWTWFDGAYMTAITLATIGYGEIPHPLSVPGRAFTMVLAYTGIFTYAYFASEVVRLVVTGELRDMLGRERMEEELATLSGHVVVCGFGRMGKVVCGELEHQGRRFVVIDKDPVPSADWPYRHGVKLHGDAAEDELLRKARIERAEALIAAVGADADNLYITLSARLLNPGLRIVARAEEPEAEAKLRKVGANQVVSPHLAGGHRAVQAALRPTALHFFELASRSEFRDLQLEEMRVGPGSRLAGRTIGESRLHEDHQTLVVGLKRGGGELVYNPTADTRLEAGSVLIVLGRQADLERVEGLLAGDGASADTPVTSAAPPP